MCSVSSSPPHHFSSSSHRERLYLSFTTALLVVRHGMGRRWETTCQNKAFTAIFFTTMMNSTRASS